LTLASAPGIRIISLIIDIRMPPGQTAEGIQAAVEIRQISPDVGLLLLSQHVETHHAMRTDNRVSEKAWATCSRTESPTWRPSPATFDASPTVTA
jgi:hypothetical protein